DTNLKGSDINLLGEILKGFYIEAGMWKDNPQERKEDLRLLNLEHTEYPKLQKFVFYLLSLLEEERETESIRGTTERGKSLSNLASVFQKIVDRNSDLFNRQTTLQESYLQQR